MSTSREGRSESLVCVCAERERIDDLGEEGKKWVGRRIADVNAYVLWVCIQRAQWSPRLHFSA